jgi:hypothetical protein
MPTVLRIGATRFFFFSNEGAEPAHIHIEQAGALAKFWLDPVALAGRAVTAGVSFADSRSTWSNTVTDS